jgi:hypothetical protein
MAVPVHKSEQVGCPWGAFYLFILPVVPTVITPQAQNHHPRAGSRKDQLCGQHRDVNAYAHCIPVQQASLQFHRIAFRRQTA